MGLRRIDDEWTWEETDSSSSTVISSDDTELSAGAGDCATLGSEGPIEPKPCDAEARALCQRQIGISLTSFNVEHHADMTIMPNIY